MSTNLLNNSINHSTESEEYKSTLISKNITILGRRTSVRLEPEMWSALKDISKREMCSKHEICTLIYIRKNPLTSLTAAIRVFLMLYYRAAATKEGHLRAGHGDFESMKKRARVESHIVNFQSAKATANNSSHEVYIKDTYLSA